MSVADEPIAIGAARSGALGPQRSAWESFWRFCVHHPRIPIFSALFLLVFIPCVLSPWVAPHDPKAPNTQKRLLGPSSEHWLGTDQLGRDIFSRLLYGGRLSIPLGLMAVAISGVIGITMGVIAGYYGGFLDQFTGRLVDAQLAFPELILAIAVANAFGTSLFNIMVIIGITGYPGYYRLTRGQVLQAREFEFVNAARALGGSQRRIMFRHILPNTLNPLIISTSFAAGGAVLLQSALSFVGLGPKAGTPDWGLMFSDALNNFRLQPWLVFGPGLAVFLSVLSFYMIGDALRDALDPHLRGKRG